jgi:hypothetical protein
MQAHPNRDNGAVEEVLLSPIREAEEVLPSPIREAEEVSPRSLSRSLRAAI